MEEEEEDLVKKLANTILAFTMKLATSNIVDNKDCLTMHTSLMVSCCICLDNLSKKDKDNNTNKDPVALKLVTKLVPVFVCPLLARN